MPIMSTPVTKHDLLAVLREMVDLVEHDDSFEGYLEYSMPDFGDPPETQFRLKAGYRVGNSRGQGGFRTIGQLTDERTPDDDVDR